MRQRGWLSGKDSQPFSVKDKAGDIMSISVEDLVHDTENKYGIQLIAGKEGLNRRVRWVHIVEDNEAPTTLWGNEFIFTTGVGNICKDKLMHYVEYLESKDISGLTLSLGRYYDEISDELIQYCDEKEFPLFTISCNTPLVSVIYDLCKKIIRKDRLDMNVAESFRNAILNPGNRESYVCNLMKQGYTEENFKAFVVRTGVPVDEDTLEHIRINIKYTLKKHIKRISVFELDGDIVMICHGMDKDISQKLIEDYLHFCSLNKDYKLSMGESSIKEGFDKISEAYQEAKTALKVAQINNRRHLYWKDVGIYGLLLTPNRESILQEFYHKYLEPLVEYDAVRGTDYTEMLQLYLENQSSVNEVSNLIYMHRNTINYRLSRIKEILQIEMDEEDKMNLRIAFLIRNLI